MHTAWAADELLSQLYPVPSTPLRLPVRVRTQTGSAHNDSGVKLPVCFTLNHYRCKVLYS